MKKQKNMSVSVVSEQGERCYMEDTHSIDEDFMGKGWFFGGVYDGHGGSRPAKYAAKYIQKAFAECLLRGHSPAEAITMAYEDVSNRMHWAVHCGTCAANFLVSDGQIHYSNAGDCRIVVVGENITELTTDHRIFNKDEAVRIHYCGGRIRGFHVVCGYRGLMPTRCLGDQPFKKIGVVATPSIGSYKIKRTDRFLVAGTDGLFDEVDNFVIQGLSKRKRKSSTYAKALLQEVQNRHGHDNLTIIVLKL